MNTQAPEPLYRSTRAVVYCGDSTAILPVIKTEVQLICTDPPYGVNFQSRHHTRESNLPKIAGDARVDDALELTQQVLGLALTKLKQHRHVYVFHPADPSVLWGVLDVNGRATLIWDKGLMSGGNVASPWGRQHETIHFGVWVPWPGKKDGARSGGVPARLRKGSVLRFQRPNAMQVRHPTEKPVGLMRELIESSSRQEDVVLDPFGGTGSTGVAAVLSGRRAVVIESDPSWAALAVERIKKAEAAWTGLRKI